MILSESTYFTVFGEDVIFMGKCFYLLLNKRGVIYIYMYTHGIQKSKSENQMILVHVAHMPYLSPLQPYFYC